MYPEAVESGLKGVLLEGMNPTKAEALKTQRLNAIKESGSNAYWQAQMDWRLERSKQNGEPVDVMDMAIYHANMGNNDKAFEFLERGFKDRRVGLVFLKVDYIWDKIRPDPRFSDLVRSVGLQN